MHRSLHSIPAGLALCALFACGSKDATGPAAEPGPPVVNASIPAEIVGSWYAGSVSPTNYHNTTTGSWDNAYGEGMFYTLRQDGKFEFGYRIYSSLYGCTITAMFWKSGTVTVNRTSQSITVIPTEAVLHSTDSCNASGNYDKPISRDPETLYWQLGKDEYGAQVLNLRWATFDEAKDFHRWNP